MATKIPIPKLGQSEETVVIDNWKVKEGDVIKKGDVLFEVETDKAVLEVESQFEGTILKILVPAGKEVPVMTIGAIVGEPGEAIPDDVAAPAAAPAPAASAAAPAAAPAPKAAAAPAAVSAPAPAAAPAPKAAAAPVAAPAVSGKLKASPRAKKFAADYLIDLKKVKGTGGNGRITEKDVKNYLDAIGYHDRKITPVAFNLAKIEKLELLDIEGTGDQGRITLADVKTAIAGRPQPMSTMRKVIAQRLSQSKQTIPHFYVTVAIEMDTVMAKRKQLKDNGINLSVNVFVLKAVALALKEFPLVNSVCDGQTVVRKQHINVGMAVSIDNGLVVPVLRDTDRMGLDEIQFESGELAEKARSGKLSPNDMKGGTFTVSNMGMMNVESFGAIINPGESGILAVASGVPTPVVRNGEIVIRNIMKVTMSADHRVVDGSMAAAFVNAVRTRLEDAALWDSMI